MYKIRFSEIINSLSTLNNLLITSIIIFATLIRYQPPDGKLLPDEEMYFGFSVQSMKENPDEYSSFGLKELKSRYLFDLINASLIENYGHSKAQIIGRTFSLILYSICLSIFFKTIRFNFFQSIICLLVFLFVGQDLFGGEWLIYCYVSKTVAYPIIFLSFSYLFKSKFYRGIICLSAVTYIHFLIGGTFFAFFVIFFCFKKLSLKMLLKYISLYLIITSPIILYVLSNYFLNTEFESYKNFPDPEWIYSYFRHPHHLVPFKDFSSFYVRWFKGIIISLPLTALSYYCYSKELNSIKKDVALLNLIIFMQLYISLIISFFDSSYFFAKFYMFRSSSMALFFSIVLSIIWLNELISKQKLKNHFNLFVFSILFFNHIAPFPWKMVQMVRNQRLGDTIENKDYAELINYILENTGKDDIILIDPGLEHELLNFERLTKRSTLVTYKYISTTKKGISEWYRRLQFKGRVFNNAALNKEYPFRFIITKEKSRLMLEKYGHPIFEKNYTVYENTKQ